VSTPYTVSALAKGLRVLSVFSEHRRELRLVEVAALTSLPVPTVFRLLKTLESEGYVEHLESGHFRPGPNVLSLGYAALQGQDVVEAARLPLKRLAEETAETVNLGTLVGTNVMYLARVKNTDLVTANVQVGSMLPAPCTSMGKLLLAFLPQDERDARLRLIDIGTCQGPHAVRSMAQLRHQLTEARERGWALQDEEVAHGLRSISAPIRDGSGEVTAALNLAVQTSRWTRKELVDHFLEPLLSAAEQTSLRLGYVGAITPGAET
jgi:IclR family transcriptional regulator, pca regulon regulatory protein